MEAVGAARNRAQAKRRKACVPWVSQPTVAKPNILLVGRMYWRRVRVKLSVPYLGRSAGLRGNTVALRTKGRGGDGTAEVG